ncbi:enoyl-CoA hydratase-related protein [Allonocardiopsis opalescens]|nr:enoyl-CoA hydratase-related protein [Allonocardiopsis opalescens]
MEVERGAARIVLDSPRNRNALSARLRTELAARLREAAADPGVRAVVLTGAGPAFCSGMDLSEVEAELRGESPDPSAPTLPELIEQVMDCPVPVVVLLNGPVRAGGVGLVAAADIAIAPDTVTFAFTEVRIGVVPAIISVPVAARMHDRQLSRYLLTGETFGAAEAAAAGLLTAAVPAEAVDAAVEGVLDGLRLAAPRAAARTKELLRELRGMDRTAALHLAERISAEFFASDDAAEGRAAFFGRRPPRWAV